MAIDINTQAIPRAFLETLTDTEFRSQRTRYGDLLLSFLTRVGWINLKTLLAEVLKDRIRERILRAGWINLKTLLGKNFRLFVNQKVPDLGVSGGKILGLFPWTLGIDPLKNPTPVRTSDVRRAQSNGRWACRTAAWARSNAELTAEAHTLHSTPHEKLFQQTLNSWAKNREKQQKSAVTPLTNSQN